MPADVILPGATLGLLGGGQLGRYFAIAARNAGYGVWVLDPDPQAPAAAFATRHLCAAYDDPASLAELGAHCAAVTTEFENAPASAMQALTEAHGVAVRPAAAAVAIAQNRILEKQFFLACGLPVGPFAAIHTAEEVELALASVAYPAIIKTARFGYDGKGQVRVASAAQAADELSANPGLLPCVVEQQLELEREISVVLGRSVDGEVRCFPVAENRHTAGILDVSMVPADISADLAEQARNIATRIAGQLDYVGVLGVEFFVLAGGALVLNEMAPRPHNSGHYTIDAGACSQFEQQVRLVCGFPPLDPAPGCAAVMVNLLGDIWQAGTPDWAALLGDPHCHLHLYGKEGARPGRKMGHFTVTGASRETALAAALALRSHLGMTD